MDPSRSQTLHVINNREGTIQIPGQYKTNSNIFILVLLFIVY